MKKIIAICAILSLFSIKGVCQNSIKTFEIPLKTLIDSNKNSSAIVDSFSTFNDSLFYIKVLNPSKDSILPISYFDQTGNSYPLKDLSSKLSLYGRDFLTLNILICNPDTNATYRDSIMYKIVDNSNKTILTHLTHIQALEYLADTIDGLTSKNIHQDTEKIKTTMCKSTTNIKVTFYRQPDTFKNPSFAAFSLIKTIAGAVPQDELLDIFLKINYFKGNRCFSMFGADAAIATKDTTKQVFKLNEAVANFNIALYLQSADPNLLKRTGFLGGGLKVFNSQAYFGAHLGSMEINGRMLGSYILAGYYYSPFLYGVKNYDSSKGSQFRHNLYFEAALNAFGDNVPSLVKSLRFKFGLLMPIAASGPNHVGDIVTPAGKDIFYRLAIEAPLGGPLKF